MLLFTVVMVFFVSIGSCDAGISCVSCPSSISINITTDTDIDTSSCTLKEDELCSLILRVEYVIGNESFALIDGSNDGGLILTNGEPQSSESMFVRFDENRAQRFANIACFSGSSCGLDLLKKIYREKCMSPFSTLNSIHVILFFDLVRLFDYVTLRDGLKRQLYNSSIAVGSELQCVDPSGATVSCPNGFCRAIFDGNGLVSVSSCVKNGLVPAPYGLVLTQTTMTDLNVDQASIIYSCNKPMCNSNENTREVLQQLIAAKLIPQPTLTTTTPKNMGTTLKNKYQEIFLSCLAVFLVLRC
ncbi:unnamed protein product [Adineta ricciae]|uniref:Uncharacterized protein n=1 Tax=Adineta ricciae TaxID=249248 RepID=A0A816GVE6_ADIRI|nr:unnamed protein product [Adineta ricciae]